MMYQSLPLNFYWKKSLLKLSEKWQEAHSKCLENLFVVGIVGSTEAVLKVFVLLFLFSDCLKVQMKCFFLFPNLKEQQNQEDCRLPFLNIFCSSRVIKV